MTGVKIDITGDNTGLIAALGQAKAAIAESTEQMKLNLESVGKTFEKIQSGILAISAIVAGGAMFKEAIESSVNWGEGVLKLSRALGVSTEKASAYAGAAQHLGITNEDLINSTSHLAKSIYSNRSEFDKLGVAVKDSGGKTRPMVDILADVNSKLLAMPDGLQRNIAGTIAYGKSWATSGDLILLSAQEVANADQRVKALGLSMSQAGAEQAERFKQGLNDVSLVGTALSQQFGQQLIPTLINFGSLISQGGPKDLNIFSNLLKGVAYVAGTVGIQFEKMGMFLGKLGAQAIALVHGDLAGVSAIQKDWENDLARLNKQADELWDKLSRPLPEQADEGNTGGGKDIQDKEDEASLLTRLEAALAQKKAIYAQDAANRGEIAEFSKQQEMQFWDEALAHETLTKQQRATIEQKIANDELGITQTTLQGKLAALKTEESAHGNDLATRLAAEQQYAAAVKSVYGADSKQYAEAQAAIVATKRATVEQQRKLDDIEAQSVRTQQLAEIGIRESAAKESLALHRITDAQYISLEEQFEAQKYAIKQQALARELTLVNPTEDPVAYRQLMAQIEAEASTHQAAMVNIAKQGDAQQITLTNNLMSAMSKGFANAFQGIVNGTMTMGQAFKSVFSSMLEAVTKFIAGWMAKSLTAHAIKMTQSKEEITADAGGAAVAGAKSAAAIPYVGWAIAIGAAASIFAAMAGYSAAGGMDVPSGINPVTQLHSKEMVLPAPLAERVRGMTDTGDTNGTNGGGPLHIHFPGKSVGGGFWMAHQDDIIDVIKHAHRRGKLG